MLKGNKGEWSELYTVLKLLADGELFAADSDMEKIESLAFPVIKILREEKEKSRHYSINGNIKIVDPKTDTLICSIKKSEFLSAAKIVFTNITQLSGRSISVNRFNKRDELLDFLDAVDISTLKAQSSDKSDITIQIHDQITGGSPTLGFSIKSMIGQKSTLFNPAAGTNFIFRITGEAAEGLDIKEFNRKTYSDKPKIKSRIGKLEELGLHMDFDKIQSEILGLNLKLIDGDLPNILAYMLAYRYTEGKAKITELLSLLYEKNPLGYDLRYGHQYYTYKIVKFLYDAALGMTPEVIWNGEVKANGGVIVVKNNGDILAYHAYSKNDFEKYLLNNTMLEQPSTSEDKSSPGFAQTKERYPAKSIKPYHFGWIYEDSGNLFLKLNLQIRFIK